MATLTLIKEAIAALKDRTGSSIPAINKWIESEKKVRCICQEKSLPASQPDPNLLPSCKFDIPTQ
jgi:linker histone H1 and H5 family